MALQRYTAEQMIDALTASKGMIFLAARRLGCSHDTVERYCKRYPTVEAARVTQRGEMLDEAEMRLWKALQQDEPWAILFCLRTLGKTRGYVPQIDTKTLTDHEGLAALVAEARAVRRAHG